MRYFIQRNYLSSLCASDRDRQSARRFKQLNAAQSLDESRRADPPPELKQYHWSRSYPHSVIHPVIVQHSLNLRALS